MQLKLGTILNWLRIKMKKGTRIKTPLLMYTKLLFKKRESTDSCFTAILHLFRSMQAASPPLSPAVQLWSAGEGRPPAGIHRGGGDREAAGGLAEQGRGPGPALHEHHAEDDCHPLHDAGRLLCQRLHRRTALQVGLLIHSCVFLKVALKINSSNTGTGTVYRIFFSEEQYFGAAPFSIIIKFDIYWNEVQRGWKKVSDGSATVP